MNHGLLLQGRFFWERRSPSGLLLAQGEVPNSVTNVGLNALLEVFRGTAFSSTWYLGLIDNTSFTAVAVGDTMASHAGWVEAGISPGDAYDETTRRTWTTPAVSGQVIANTAVATFTFNANKTIKGLFLVDSSTKGGTAGVLWCTGLFDTNQVAAAGETLSLIYSLTAAGSG